MNRTAAGVFDTYTAAGKVVRELELLGISGEQVEVVNDASHDVRGIGVVPQPKDDQSDSPEDYTMVIVRPSDDEAMEQTKHLMDRYGAKLFRWQISVDGAPTTRDGAGKSPQTSIGDLVRWAPIRPISKRAERGSEYAEAIRSAPNRIDIIKLERPVHLVNRPFVFSGELPTAAYG